MNLYIDIDGTICGKSPNSDEYKDRLPFEDRIQKVNELYDKGNTIVYWTARGSKTGVNYEELTREQLQKWGCKYHELKFGKPPYDLYIDDKSHNVNVVWPRQPTSKISKPLKAEKGWGYELLIENNKSYCGKILHFKQGAKFSMHFHIQKRETWYVQSGCFKFRGIKTETADVFEEDLRPGDVLTNERGEPHQIICIEEGDIFEVSTQHFDCDSYRVMKGDSQQT